MQGDLQQALRKLIDRVSERVRADQTVPAYLAGGVGTYLHLESVGGALAEKARHSEDADIHFGRPLLLGEDLVVGYEDLQGEERLLALDGSYSIDIGLRHPDCFESADFLFESDNGRVQLYLLSPLDLAVTKTGRFQDHDRTDIELMARAGLLDADEFRQRASESLEYLATDPGMIRINIDDAAELVEKATAPRQ